MSICLHVKVHLLDLLIVPALPKRLRRWLILNRKLMLSANKIFLPSGQNIKKSICLLLFLPNIFAKESPSEIPGPHLSNTHTDQNHATKQ